MSAHTWILETVDGGSIGTEDFWVCSGCSASGGGGNKPALPFLAGWGYAEDISLDCETAKVQIAKLRFRPCDRCGSRREGDGPYAFKAPCHRCGDPDTAWRTGSKLGRTLYRGEVFVGTVDTKELAEEIVTAMNKQVPEVKHEDYCDLVCFHECSCGASGR